MVFLFVIFGSLVWGAFGIFLVKRGNPEATHEDWYNWMFKSTLSLAGIMAVVSVL